MRTDRDPVSVRLDPELKRRATAYARRRKVGLTTALRMIISEYLDGAEATADLDAALLWQREQAWATLDRWTRGEARELSLDEVREAHGKALRKSASMRNRARR